MAGKRGVTVWLPGDLSPGRYCCGGGDIALCCDGMARFWKRTQPKRNVGVVTVVSVRQTLDVQDLLKARQ